MKTLWKKEKMLESSSLSFSHHMFSHNLFYSSKTFQFLCLILLSAKTLNLDLTKILLPGNVLWRRFLQTLLRKDKTQVIYHFLFYPQSFLQDPIEIH